MEEPINVNMFTMLPFVPQCPHCKQTFGKAVHAAAHVPCIRLVDGQHQCPDCNRQFEHLGKLAHHRIKTHLPPRLCCKICEKCFRTRILIVRHIEKEHMGINRYPCRECSQSFLTTSERDRHVSSDHPHSLLRAEAYKPQHHPSPSSSLSNDPVTADGDSSDSCDSRDSSISGSSVTGETPAELVAMLNPLSPQIQQTVDPVTESVPSHSIPVEADRSATVDHTMYQAAVPGPAPKAGTISAETKSEILKLLTGKDSVNDWIRTASKTVMTIPESAPPQPSPQNFGSVAPAVTSDLKTSTPAAAFASVNILCAGPMPPAATPVTDYLPTPAVNYHSVAPVIAPAPQTTNFVAGQVPLQSHDTRPAVQTAGPAPQSANSMTGYLTAQRQNFQPVASPAGNNPQMATSATGHAVLYKAFHQNVRSALSPAGYASHPVTPVTSRPHPYIIRTAPRAGPASSHVSIAPASPNQTAAARQPPPAYKWHIANGQFQPQPHPNSQAHPQPGMGRTVNSGHHKMMFNQMGTGPYPAHPQQQLLMQQQQQQQHQLQPQHYRQQQQFHFNPQLTRTTGHYGGNPSSPAVTAQQFAPAAAQVPEDKIDTSDLKLLLGLMSHCETCDGYFLSEDMLQNHLKKHKADIGPVLVVEKVTEMGVDEPVATKEVESLETKVNDPLESVSRASSPEEPPAPAAESSGDAEMQCHESDMSNTNTAVKGSGDGDASTEVSKLETVTQSSPEAQTPAIEPQSQVSTTDDSITPQTDAIVVAETIAPVLTIEKVDSEENVEPDLLTETEESDPASIVYQRQSCTSEASVPMDVDPIPNCFNELDDSTDTIDCNAVAESAEEAASRMSEVDCDGKLADDSPQNKDNMTSISQTLKLGSDNTAFKDKHCPEPAQLDVSITDEIGDPRPKQMKEIPVITLDDDSDDDDI